MVVLGAIQAMQEQVRCCMLQRVMVAMSYGLGLFTSGATARTMLPNTAQRYWACLQPFARVEYNICVFEEIANS